MGIAMFQKVFSASPEYARQRRRWLHLDAEGRPLGRLASQAAGFLIGKHKPFYDPHVDCGDFVVITNAGKVGLTGNKIDQKVYFRHSGYASGKKIIPIRRQMEKDPRRVVELAVKRMLNPNRLRDLRMGRLKVYAGPEHPHQAQAPVKVPWP